jgi:hypothetical protein
VAARHHAQLLNVERVAQQAAMKRRTVDTYFEILADTLLGFRLPALRLGMRAKKADPDAGELHVWFDERAVETGHGGAREAPADERTGNR